MQVEKSPKPVASCAMPAGPGMKIKTDTPLVKKAREGVMEFLLVSSSSSTVMTGSWQSSQQSGKADALGGSEVLQQQAGSHDWRP
jgi:predicted molibdopterin-dependent oxidoreductase YjgC